MMLKALTGSISGSQTMFRDEIHGVPGFHSLFNKNHFVFLCLILRYQINFHLGKGVLRLKTENHDCPVVDPAQMPLGTR